MSSLASTSVWTHTDLHANSFLFFTFLRITGVNCHIQLYEVQGLKQWLCESQADTPSIQLYHQVQLHFQFSPVSFLFSNNLLINNKQDHLYSAWGGKYTHMQRPEHIILPGNHLPEGLLQHSTHLYSCNQLVYFPMNQGLMDSAQAGLELAMQARINLNSGPPASVSKG